MILAAHLNAIAVAALTAVLQAFRVEPANRITAVRAAMLAALALALWPEATPAWAPPAPAVAPDVPFSLAIAPATTQERALAPAAAVPWQLVGALFAAGGAARLLSGLVQLRQLVRRTRVVRTRGRVQIRVGNIPGPCTVWTPLGAMILFDQRTWSNLPDRSLALRHELHHLRHGDAMWAWPLAAAEAITFGNPVAAWLARHVRHAEELAVDRRLVQSGVPAKRYADLLLRTAITSPPLAAALGRPPMLERIAMLRSPLRRLPWAVALVLGLLPIALTASAGGLAETSMVDGLQEQPAIVQSRLRYILATPRARIWMTRGLDNRAQLGPAVDAALYAAGLPSWLAAVPLIESAYDDLDPSVNPMKAAGVWQFIPETARRMGLIVDGTTDQRRDLSLATPAAIRLLSDLHDSLGDWGLALAAYNVGEKRVRQAMADGGTRDPWALIEAGLLPTYAADVAAGAVLLAHPALLKP